VDVAALRAAQGAGAPRHAGLDPRADGRLDGGLAASSVCLRAGDEIAAVRRQIGDPVASRAQACAAGLTAALRAAGPPARPALRRGGKRRAPGKRADGGAVRIGPSAASSAIGRRWRAVLLLDVGELVPEQGRRPPRCRAGTCRAHVGADGGGDGAVLSRELAARRIVVRARWRDLAERAPSAGRHAFRAADGARRLR
jgi:hypothetical protein